MYSSKLKDFYHSFFDGHYFRDIDYIRGNWWKPRPAADPDGADVRQWTDRLRWKVRKNTDDIKSIRHFKRNARYFLSQKQHRDGMGQLVHHNSYFNNVPDFHSLNRDDRQYDRLLYDVDKHDDRIDDFKHELMDIKVKPTGKGTDYTYKQKLKDIKDVHRRYQEYIFTNDFLADPYHAAMKVMDYYHDRGVEPVLICTGGAGFHINVLFEPAHLKNPNELSLSYLNLIGRKCNVPVGDGDDNSIANLDPAVSKNAVTGTQRTPYSVHEKSGLHSFIIPPDTCYDDVLQVLERNSPSVLSDFSYEEHLVPDLLREQILKMDGLAGQKKEQKKESSSSSGCSLTVF